MVASADIFLLGLMCGATALIALYSLIIGSAYRGTGLWWLAAALGVGMLPVVLEVPSVLQGRSEGFSWGRSSAWAAVALSCQMLRQVLGQTGSQRWPSRALQGVALLAGLAAVLGLFPLQWGLSRVLGPLWLLATGAALSAGWRLYAPWIYWLAAGQGAMALGWAGLLVLQSQGVAPSQMQATLWKALLLTLFGATSYMALVWRSRLRKEVHLRAKAVERVDRLTGLALPRVFMEQLDAAQARAGEFGYRNALLDLQVSNLQQLAKDRAHGHDEFALLAASRAISAVLRGVDTATRLADNRFVVLVEGLAAEETVRETAMRFVASGLRLSVKFHCAAGVLDPHGESMPVPQAVLDRLAREQAAWPVAEQGTAIREIDLVPPSGNV